MTRIMTSLLAGTAIFGLSAAAHAADMGAPFRAPQVVGAAADPGTTSTGWYLRGDVGIGINSDPKLDSSGPSSVDSAGRLISGAPSHWLRQDIADTPFISAGVGYQFSDYLRGDLTAEYRSATRFRGNAVVAHDAGTDKYPYYDGQFRAFDVMANGYVDLGTYNGLTPYVGAGIGAAYVKLGDTYEHTSFPYAVGGTYADGVLPGNSKWNFAWALHTGVAWDVNPRLKLELGYTYKDLGSIQSKELQCNYSTGVDAHCQEWLSLKRLATNDLHLGMRWLLDPKDPKAPAYAPMAAPVVAKY